MKKSGVKRVMGGYTEKLKLKILSSALHTYVFLIYRGVPCWHVINVMPKKCYPRLRLVQSDTNLNLSPVLSWAWVRNLEMDTDCFVVKNSQMDKNSSWSWWFSSQEKKPWFITTIGVGQELVGVVIIPEICWMSFLPARE